ncbi:DUF892 family protein [Olivibacter sp. SDN3]|uniref:DUF892 family protein n=1 Tax=Olivibacter sp. SDN3 TaxID=2764720 RepID=UPI001651656F|nr:DUF892 family protein [Olivibacter sp. SDN3]QNL48377.1 DUF892 family protein [Olivibacter sp. SDN3]
METQQDSNFRAFLIEQLKVAYWADKKIVEVLPALQKAASIAKLKEILTIFLEEKKNHIIRLEHAFSRADEPPATKRCQEIIGILAEGNKIMDDTQGRSVLRDVGIIFMAKKLVHYGIATYGALLTLSQIITYEHMDEVLHENLVESEKMDSSLTAIAKNDINIETDRESKE